MLLNYHITNPRYAVHFQIIHSYLLCHDAWKMTVRITKFVSKKITHLEIYY